MERFEMIKTKLSTMNDSENLMNAYEVVHNHLNKDPEIVKENVLEISEALSRRYDINADNLLIVLSLMRNNGILNILYMNKETKFNMER